MQRDGKRGTPRQSRLGGFWPFLAAWAFRTENPRVGGSTPSQATSLQRLSGVASWRLVPVLERAAGGLLFLAALLAAGCAVESPTSESWDEPLQAEPAAIPAASPALIQIGDPMVIAAPTQNAPDDIRVRWFGDGSVVLVNHTGRYIWVWGDWCVPDYAGPITDPSDIHCPMYDGKRRILQPRGLTNDKITLRPKCVMAGLNRVTVFDTDHGVMLGYHYFRATATTCH